MYKYHFQRKSSILPHLAVVRVLLTDGLFLRRRARRGVGLHFRHYRDRWRSFHMAWPDLERKRDAMGVMPTQFRCLSSIEGGRPRPLKGRSHFGPTHIDGIAGDSVQEAHASWYLFYSLCSGCWLSALLRDLDGWYSPRLHRRGGRRSTRTGGLGLRHRAEPKWKGEQRKKANVL